MNIITRIKKALAAMFRRRARYRMVPVKPFMVSTMADNYYALEHYSGFFWGWELVQYVTGVEHAREVIANLERPIIPLEDKP